MVIVVGRICGLLPGSGEGSGGKERGPHGRPFRAAKREAASSANMPGEARRDRILALVGGYIRRVLGLRCPVRGDAGAGAVSLVTRNPAGSESGWERTSVAEGGGDCYTKISSMAR